MAGQTWLTATGTTNWTYPFVGQTGIQYSLRARGTDTAGTPEATPSTSEFLLAVSADQKQYRWLDPNDAPLAAENSVANVPAGSQDHLRVGIGGLQQIALNRALGETNANQETNTGIFTDTADDDGTSQTLTEGNAEFLYVRNVASAGDILADPSVTVAMPLEKFPPASVDRRGARSLRGYDERSESDGGEPDDGHGRGPGLVQQHDYELQQYGSD